MAGLGEGEASEVGNFDLAAMDGEAHGDERGEKRDDEHGERAENDVEESVDPGDSHCLVRIYAAILRRGCFIPVFVQRGLFVVFAVRLTPGPEEIGCGSGHGESW